MTGIPPIDPGTPPRRPPASAAPAEIGFVPQRRVRWFAPGVLLGTAVQVLLSGTLAQYADRRETQAVDPAGTIDLSGDGELWVDYVSDPGDGFDAATTVASVLARDELELSLDGRRHATRAGALLVFGGDQVYPSASVRAYEDRLVGPYRSMLPWTDRPRRVLAVPGNHDWYDGLASFLRLFCQRRWIGGWRTEQQRSYFAVRLPGSWHLWGLDVALDTDLDSAQIEYFRTQAAAFGPDDAVLLCWSKPGWIEAGAEHPEAYATMEFVERTVLRDRRRLRVSLAGDSHHYARYEGPDGEQKITAGGGGAYLSDTHHLPSRLELPPRESRDPHKAPPTTFEHRVSYPDAATSRRLRWGVFGSIHRNGWFPTLPAALYALLALVVTRAFAGAVEPGPVAIQVPELVFGIVLVIVVGAALLGFTQRAGPRTILLAAGHTAAHLILVLGAVGLVAALDPSSWGSALVFVAAMAAGGLLGPLVLAGYLLVADSVGPNGTNANELFAAQGLESHKCFLRLHVAADGTLTVYPVKVQRVSRWRFAPSTDRTARWFLPDAEPVPELIEPPIVIPRRPDRPGPL